ncbi:MAG: phosphoenolpyruvate hydrolase family protein [Paracoccaceae bacterium]
MLLPTGPGSRQIVDALTTSPHLFDGAITGLLVTDPAINFERTIKSMKAANNRWVANLPTIGLHDAEFKSFLNEVALGVSKEIEILAKFKARGIKIMAVLADFPQAEAMALLDPDAIVILPKVSGFLDGWPSLATRKKNERVLRAALSQNGWNGPCLGYRAKNEDNNGWPCLERPNLLTR